MPLFLNGRYYAHKVIHIEKWWFLKQRNEWYEWVPEMKRWMYVAAAGYRQSSVFLLTFKYGEWHWGTVENRMDFGSADD